MLAFIRRIGAFAPLLLACCLSLSGCVYFNTFYNAKKFYRQAEKERVKHEEVYAGWAFDGAGPELQRQRSNQADQLYDKAARKAKLRLDRKGGDKDWSALVKRINSRDPEEQMPPPKTGKKLQPKQIVKRLQALVSRSEAE